MRINSVGVPSVLLAILLVNSLAILSQTAGVSAATRNETADSPNDLAGVWAGNVTADNVASMLPWAQAKFDANTAELKRGRPITTDPIFRCEPGGMPRAYQMQIHPFEIVQIPGRILLFYEAAHNWRTIWMDGRELSRGADASPWMGYSVGHWEGETLVVNTIGFNDKTWLDRDGHPHSADLHVVERVHRVDHDTLQLEVTINDPKAYTRSWTMRGTYKLQPTWEIGEDFCIPEEQLNFKKRVLEPTGKP